MKIKQNAFSPSSFDLRASLRSARWSMKRKHRYENFNILSRPYGMLSEWAGMQEHRGLESICILHCLLDHMYDIENMPMSLWSYSGAERSHLAAKKCISKPFSPFSCSRQRLLLKRVPCAYDDFSKALTESMMLILVKFLEQHQGAPVFCRVLQHLVRIPNSSSFPQWKSRVFLAVALASPSIVLASHTLWSQSAWEFEQFSQSSANVLWLLATDRSEFRFGRRDSQHFVQWAEARTHSERCQRCISLDAMIPVGLFKLPPLLGGAFSVYRADGAGLYVFLHPLRRELHDLASRLQGFVPDGLIWISVFSN